MYVRDKSVPVSALTNQQADNQPLFLAGQLGMMISHPSDYNVMLDLQKKATGADKDKAQTVIDNMRYGLIPDRPGRQARRRVRRLEHSHPEARICRGRQGGRAGCKGDHLHVDEP
jgi:hypothetical protein